jgi:hypothetical protein
MLLKLGLTAVLCVLLLSNCGPSAANLQTAKQTAQPREALFIPENAESLKVSNGGNAIAFELNEAYPAERALLGFDNHYRPPQWRKEDDLRLFPGRRTSENPGGWARYLEGDQMVYLQVTNWVDASGNSVTYVTRYKFEASAPPSGGRARVEAIYQAAK